MSATVMLEPDVARLAPALAAIRRTVHEHPEMGFEEVRPAALVAERLQGPGVETVPGCYAVIGSSNAARGLVHPHHSPRFDFDEAALPIGVQLLVKTAERFLAS